jgi:mono/diheme cytochrome c family protein
MVTTLVSGQTPWVVPSDWNVKLSSTPFTDQNRKTGAELYLTNCKSCHGDPGKNNVIQLVPPPPDPSSVLMQQNSDGALHYKISEGRVTMPSFKNIVNSADIWNIIAYLRSFNKEYIQQTAPKPLFAGESFDKVNLELFWDAPNRRVVHG